MYACSRGHVSVAELLLRSGASYNLKNNVRNDLSDVISCDMVHDAARGDRVVNDGRQNKTSSATGKTPKMVVYANCPEPSMRVCAFRR